MTVLLPRIKIDLYKESCSLLNNYINHLKPKYYPGWGNPVELQMFFLHFAVKQFGR